MVEGGGRGFRLGREVETVTEATERMEEARPLRFRRYSAYKDSGIECLGEIPAHWEVKRLKFLLQEALQYGANEPAELMDPDLPRYIRITDVGEDGRLREETFRSIPKDVARPYLLQDGDLLFARSGATVGKTFRFEPSWGRAAYAGYLIRARLKLQRCSSRFVQYFTKSKSYWAWLQTNFIQATIQNVSAERYANLGIALPELREQQEIVSLLDRETARIDGLVARKERLIELLQEKRTALITRAVTRGLDPNVSMKDSGVEWLGKIPVHWEVKSLKHLTPGVTVGIVVTPSKYYVNEGVPCLRSLNVSRGAIDMENLVFISENSNQLHRKSKIFAGDVVVVRTGQAGTAAVVPKELDGANCIDLLIVRRSEQVLSQFVYYYLNSCTAISQAAELSVGAIQAHYNTSTLAQLVVPKIPTDEQSRIVTHLDQATGEIDALIAKIRQAIDHLKEFRTALISAAVTGKIDVREEAS